MISRHVRVFEKEVSSYLPHISSTLSALKGIHVLLCMLWCKFKCFPPWSPFDFNDNIYSLYPNQIMNPIVCFARVLWTVNLLEVMRDFFYRKVLSYFFIACAISIRCKSPKTVSTNDWPTLLRNMPSPDRTRTAMRRPCERGTASEVKTAISIVSKKAKDTWNSKFVLCSDLYSCSY